MQKRLRKMTGTVVSQEVVAAKKQKESGSYRTLYLYCYAKENSFRLCGEQ